MIVSKFQTNQRISENAFGAMVNGPSAVEQKGNEFRLEVGVLDVVGISQEGNTQCNELIADCRDHDIGNVSISSQRGLRRIEEES